MCPPGFAGGGGAIQQILSTTGAGQCVRLKSEEFQNFEEFQNNRCILGIIIIGN